MTELVQFPQVLDSLAVLLKAGFAELDEVALPLRAMQRSGLTESDIRVHIERLRAANDASEGSEAFDENALIALDVVTGSIPGASLSWLPPDTARVHIPMALRAESIAAAVLPGFRASDLLPPRPGTELTSTDVSSLATRLTSELQENRWKPEQASTFRTPKTGFGSRPAALLAPRDRIVYEALGDVVAPSLNVKLPDSVVWPRGSDQAPSYSDFAEAPTRWDSAYVILADIEAFYECVDHAILANTLESNFVLSRSYVKGLESFLDTVMGSTDGLPQGPGASETFASAYLISIDVALNAHGWPHARYADDILIAADSLLDGRTKLEELEEILRGYNLRLSGAKTRILHTDTYIAALSQPSKRAKALTAEIRSLLEAELLDLGADSELSPEESQRVEEILRSAGADDELLWDVLYHDRTSISEAIDRLREGLAPPLADAYARYFHGLTTRLRTRDLPDSFDSAEKNLKDCLLYMASGREKAEPLDLLAALRWLPRLTPDVAGYLIAVADSLSTQVTHFLTSVLGAKDDIDWVTAWLCHVIEAAPALISEELTGVLVMLATDRSVGQLTRAGAVRSLARARVLDADTYAYVLSTVEPAVRAELILARRGSEPGDYPPIAPKALEPEVNDASTEDVGL